MASCYMRCVGMMLSSDGPSVWPHIAFEDCLCGPIFPLRAVCSCVASCFMWCEGMMLSSDGLSVWPHIARTAREMLPKLCRPSPCVRTICPEIFVFGQIYRAHE